MKLYDDTKDLLGKLPSPEDAFDGETYKPDRDYPRLKGQLSRVFAVMSDGEWITLRELSERVGGSEASVSARLRDLRKAKYGSLYVQREHLKNGLFRYRLRRG